MNRPTRGMSSGVGRRPFARLTGHDPSRGSERNATNQVSPTDRRILCACPIPAARAPLTAPETPFDEDARPPYHPSRLGQTAGLPSRKKEASLVDRPRIPTKYLGASVWLVRRIVWLVRLEGEHDRSTASDLGSPPCRLVRSNRSATSGG